MKIKGVTGKQLLSGGTQRACANCDKSNIDDVKKLRYVTLYKQYLQHFLYSIE